MWPKLPGPSVFIATPGDVRYLRDAAARVLDDLRASGGDDHGVGVYDWIVDKAEDGFAAWRPAQEQIPLPSDPDCRAVICILGERLGTELPADFPCEPVAPFLNEATHGPRVVHPMTAGAAESGGFALTGTVFECLAALASNKAASRLSDVERGSPPALIIFVGDSTLLDEPDPFFANWGGLRLLAEGRARHRTPGAQRAWEDREYRPQIAQLRNLLAFFQQQGVNFRIVADEEAACAEIRRFLQRALDLDARADHKPFKGLEPYGEEDADVFFGRAGERLQAVGDLRALFDNPTRLTAYGVIGGSGAGKSSFLRAGLVAHLVHTTSAGYYRGCVLRPVEILPAQDRLAAVGRADDGLRAIVTAALRAIDARAAVEQKLALLDKVAPEFQPQEAVELVLAALRDKGEGWRLLIGFDQFEELLDQRFDPKLGPRWLPVVRCIEAAARSRRIAVLYTLQANRVHLMADDPLLGPLLARGGNQTLDFPTSSISEVISKPFARAGIEVEPRLGAALRSKIDSFSQSVVSSTRGNLLPLVSLALLRLGEAAAALRAASPAAGASDAPGRVLLTLDECQHLIEIGESIATLSEEAFAAARAGSGPDWSDDTLGDLLRQLVRLGGTERERLSLPLAAIPRAGAPAHLARALLDRRILVREVGERMRLVHESVFHHWPRAIAWLAKERRLLTLHGIIGYRALEWDRNGRNLEEPRDASMRDVDEGAELLTLWYSVFSPSDPETLAPADAVVRDYILALLMTHPEPDRVIAPSPTGGTHMHLAAALGDAGLVRAYLAISPAAANFARKDGRTPLFGPCFTGRIDVLELLLEAGAAPDVMDDQGWRAVHAAAFFGHLDCLQALHAGGARLDEASEAVSNTTLVLATRHRREDILRWLVDHGAPVDALTTSGWTALHAAASEGAASIVRFLIERGATVDRRRGAGWTALHAAAWFGQLDAARELLDAGASVGSLAGHDSWVRPAHSLLGVPRGALATPLHVACDRGHVDIVRLLLARGADANADAFPRASGRDPDDLSAGVTPSPEGWTLLHLAADRGHAAVCAALAACYSNVDVAAREDLSPLGLALIRGLVDVAEALRTAGADIDRCQAAVGTPLQAAAANNNVAAIRFLLGAGADGGPSAVEPDPPIVLAAAAGHAAAVGAMLAAPQAAVRRGEAGATALHVAAMRGNLEVVRVLLDGGAPIDARDDCGQTALHLAITGPSRSRLDIAQFLISRASKLTGARDVAGWTALHRAAQAGHVELVRTLVAAGSRVDERSDAPVMTPLQAAAEVGQNEVVALLLELHAARDASAATKAPPAVLACRNRHYGTVLQLLDAGDAHDAALVEMLTEQFVANQRRRKRARAPLDLDEIRVAQALRQPAPAVDDVDGLRWRTGTRLWAARNRTWALPPVACGTWQLIAPADALERLAPAPPAGRAIDDLTVDGMRALQGAFEVVEARLVSSEAPRTALLLPGARGLRLASQGVCVLDGSAANEGLAVLHLAFFCATITCGGDAFVVFERPEQLRPHPRLPHGVASSAAGLARAPRVSTVRTGRANAAVGHWRRLLEPTGDPRAAADDAAEWRIDAVIQFGDGLFDCVFGVRSDGQVTLLDDRRLAAGLSAHVDTFTAGVRSARLFEAADPPSFHEPPLPGDRDPRALRHSWRTAIDGRGD
jgi:ankyrin repeat protein